MEIVVRHRDREENIHLEKTTAGYRVTVGEESYEVDVSAISDDAHSLLIDGQQVEVSMERKQTGRRGTGHYVVTGPHGVDVVDLMDPLTFLAQTSRGDGGGGGSQKVTAYMPGQVVEILLEEGATVEAGQGVLVLEAMKMKNEIQAETGGTIQQIFVEEGQAVEGGDPLFEIG